MSAGPQAPASALRPSLKRLFAGHELTLLLLVGVSVGCGGFALYQAVEHAEFARRNAALGFAVQSVDVDLAEGLRDATHAVAMLDSQGAALWRQRAARIESTLAESVAVAGTGPAAVLLEELARAYAVIAADLQRLFRGAPLNREAQRIRLLGRSYRDSALGRFELAVGAALDHIGQAQLEASAELSRRVRSLLMLMPLPLLLAMVLVWRSRQALERQVLAPLRALGAAAGALPDDLDRPAHRPDGAAELVELAAAFNRMQQSLRDSRELLARQERQAALGALVPVVAHNIRNPLASIRANAQLLDVAAEAEEIVESRQAIMDTVDRLGAWVNGLLSYLGPIRPQPQRLDVATTVAAAVALIRHLLESKQLRLESALPEPDAASIRGDRALTEQLIHGLLLNAVEAAPAGATLNLRWLAADASLQIDNPGPELGFTPQPVAVLKPGPTSKTRGTGLGIPFAFKVCEAHGWALAFATPRAGLTRVLIRFHTESKEQAHE